MTQRAQIATLAILFVALAVVFVLVGDAGVSTNVYSADPTDIPPAPTATAMPEISAASWEQVSPNSLVFTGETTAEMESITIEYSPVDLSSLITQYGLTPPDQDDPNSQLTIMNQFKDLLDSDVERLGLVPAPDGVTGPAIEMIDAALATTLRYEFPAQTLGAEEFAGLDLAYVWVDNGEDAVNQVIYSARGPLDPKLYASFRLWLAENIDMFSGADAESEDVDADDVDSDAQGAGADDTGADADGDAQDTDAEAPETEAVPDETWTELAPGQFMYTANPNAMIMHNTSTVEELAASLELEPAPEGEPLSLIDYLEIIDAQFAEDLAAQGMDTSDVTFESPTTEEFDGVPVAFLRAVFPPQTTPEGQATPGQESFLGMIDKGEGQIEVIQFFYQGDPDPEIYEDFRLWLTENAAELALPVEQPEATQSDAPDDAGAEDTDTTESTE